MEFSFTPAALTIVLAGGLMIIAGPRRMLLPTILLVSAMVPMQNRMTVFTLDLMVHRLLVIFAWTRLLARREHRGFELSRIDKLMIAYTAWSTLSYVLLWGTFGSLIYKLGIAYDTLGLYLFFRMVLRTEKDFISGIRALGITSVVLAAVMSTEFLTHRNPLSFLGTIPVVWNRMGTFRCQAAFGHPISAGLFGATLLPLWVAVFRQQGPIRRWALVGVATSTIITVTSGSSSTILAYAAAVVAILLWHFRRSLHIIRWTAVITLICMHIVMKAPVWALVARANVFGGSTGYHRYLLLDRFFRRVGDWWLIGIANTQTWGQGLWDVCNQFVLEGVRGGILRLGLFIAILALCFREVGLTLRASKQDRARAHLAWALGAMMFSHCVGFFGYDYWDQIIVLWYMLIAMMAGCQNLPGMRAEPATAASKNEPEPAPAYVPA